MSGEDAPPGREEPANIATAAGVEASNSAGEGSPEAVPEKAGTPAQPAEPVEEKKPEVAQSGSNAAEAGATTSPAEPVEEKKPEAAATGEPSALAEVEGPTQAAEPVEEKKPEATATEAGEASPTAEAVVGPAPSTQPVEEKPEVAQSGSNAAEVAQSGSNAAEVAQSGSNAAEVAQSGSNAAEVAQSGSNAAEVAQSGSNAAEAGATASPAEPVEEKKPEAAATEEPSAPAEVERPTQAAEPVEEKKPEATATEAGEASPTAEAVVGPAPSTQPVEEKPEAAATEEPSAPAEVGGPAQAAEPVEEQKPEATATEAGEASPTAEAVVGPAPSTQPVEEKPEAAATEEPSAPAEVEGPTQAAEPVEEKKPEATATEAGEASPTAEAVVGPAPSTQPVEEKPEASATEAGEASPTAEGKESTAEATPSVEIPQDLSTTEEKQEETERHKDQRKESPEFNWSSLSVATEDVLESLETAVQYTSMAQKLRAKGLIPRAIRMMERALMITERSELEHPALALEACKVRLNFAAYLSEGYRNREEAQDSLTRLAQWALQCPPEDLAVQALGREARTLHCSAVVAEAAALDLFEDDGQPPLAEMSEELKEAARATSSTMPPDHPLPFLVRKAFGTSAANRTSQRRRSVLKDVRRMTVSNIPLSPTAAPAGEDPLPAVTAPPETELPKLETPPQAKNKKRLDDSLSRSKRSAEDRDVFRQYLRDREMARVAHLLSLSDDWEMQTRRKLEEVHRQAKFELELTNVDELKEKRYSRLGHKVYMHQMKTMNKSWSDPNISREAKKDKTAPEIFHLKKLSRKIYVKPPTVLAPAPAPPPKPKVDQALAGSMKALRAEEHQ